MLEGGENSDQVVVVVCRRRRRRRRWWWLREPTARCGERRAELDTALES